MVPYIKNIKKTFFSTSVDKIFFGKLFLQLKNIGKLYQLIVSAMPSHKWQSNNPTTQLTSNTRFCTAHIVVG